MFFKNPRGYRWCFTVNNYSPCDITRIASISCPFFIFGLETAPTTGTPHLQGYIEFTQYKRRSAVQKLIHPKAHLEPAKGNRRQNIIYCSKSGDIHCSDPCITAALTQYNDLPLPEFFLNDPSERLYLLYNWHCNTDYLDYPYKRGTSEYLEQFKFICREYQQHSQWLTQRGSTPWAYVTNYSFENSDESSNE